MRGKTKESHYLITKLFATDYFYFYCKPLLFFTYFFPYQISKNGQFSTYEVFEYEKKMNDIREEKFGKYGNYASQGFGNIAFYESQYRTSVPRKGIRQGKYTGEDESHV